MEPRIHRLVLARNRRHGYFTKKLARTCPPWFAEATDRGFAEGAVPPGQITLRRTDRVSSIPTRGFAVKLSVTVLPRREVRRVKERIHRSRESLPRGTVRPANKLDSTDRWRLGVSDNDTRLDDFESIRFTSRGIYRRDL